MNKVIEPFIVIFILLLMTTIIVLINVYLKVFPFSESKASKDIVYRIIQIDYKKLVVQRRFWFFFFYWVTLKADEKREWSFRKIPVRTFTSDHDAFSCVKIMHWKDTQESKKDKVMYTFSYDIDTNKFKYYNKEWEQTEQP